MADSRAGGGHKLYLNGIWGHLLYLSSKPLDIIPFWKPEDKASSTKPFSICFRTVLKIPVTSVNKDLPRTKILHVTYS